MKSPDEFTIPPIIYASFGNNLPALNELISAKANVNAKNNRGYTPLMVAAINGYTDIVKALLKAGVNKTIKRSGRTAEDMAKANGKTDIEKLLSGSIDLSYMKKSNKNTL